MSQDNRHCPMAVELGVRDARLCSELFGPQLRRPEQPGMEPFRAWCPEGMTRRYGSAGAIGWDACMWSLRVAMASSWCGRLRWGWGWGQTCHMGTQDEQTKKLMASDEPQITWRFSPHLVEVATARPCAGRGRNLPLHTQSVREFTTELLKHHKAQRG